MKININEVADYISEVSNYDLFTYESLIMLVKHFEYSIKGINSYEELTNEEKQFISEDIFRFLTTWGK